MSTDGWCCETTDNNALWYNDKYSTEDWLQSLEFMARRYKHNPRMIGVDIRNEPRMDDLNKEMPWWGYESGPVGLTRLLGWKLVDWRVAAARGAVATWKGNPNTLVIVEGFFFAMNLYWAHSRPLKFSQQCLFSRLGYENHDYSHFLFDVWNWADNPLKPFTIFNDLRRQQRGEAGNMHENMREAKMSYNRFKEVRHTAFHFIWEEDIAPVWVGEFGDWNRNSTYWLNLMRYYREYDTDWCYWPLDPYKYAPGVNPKYPAGLGEGYGLFDGSHGEYGPVVGWKLQDLVGIQAPQPETPTTLPVPETCDFIAASNEAKALEPSSYWEMLATSYWNLWSVIWFILFILLSCACCGGLSLLAYNRGRQQSETSGGFALLSKS